MSSRLPLAVALLEDQRADPHQLAVAADQPAAAPERVRRGGEDRVVQHVFPIAGEFLAADHACLHRMMAAAAGGEHHLVAHLQAVGITHLERRQVEPAQRLHQAEAALLVVGQRMARHRAAIGGGDPDRLRLGDQVADGGDQAALADHDAAARPLGAERARGEGVGGT